jgi:hypothetical protein
MPKKVTRTSLNVALLAVRQGVPTVLLTASVSTGVLAKCILLSAPSAEMKLRCRFGPAVTDPSIAAIASAGRVAAQADVTRASA